MSTHSLIAKDLGDGTVESIYCQFDGYLEGVGYALQDHYTDPDKINALIALGDLSYIGKEIGEEHSLSGSSIYCGAYHRDGGEDWEDVKPHIVPLVDLMRYSKEERGAYHVYLFRNGQWMIPNRKAVGEWDSIAQVKQDLAELERLKAKYEND